MNKKSVNGAGILLGRGLRFTWNKEVAGPVSRVARDEDPRSAGKVSFGSALLNSGGTGFKSIYPQGERAIRDTRTGGTVVCEIWVMSHSASRHRSYDFSPVKRTDLLLRNRVLKVLSLNYRKDLIS